MDNLDKEFHNRFQYEKLSTDDFDVENLWNSVINRLEEKPKRRPIFLFFFTGCLFSALLLTGIATAVFSSFGNQNISPDSKIQNSNPPSTIVAESKLEVKIPKQNSFKEKEQISITQTSKNLSTTILEKQNKLFPTKQEKAIITSALTKPLVAPSTKEEAPLASFLSTPDENTNNIVQQKGDTETIIREPTLLLSTLPSIALETLQYPQVNYSLPVFTVVDRLDKPSPQEEKKTTIEINFSGGVNQTIFDFNHSENASISDLKTQAESSDYGQRFGVDLSWITPKGWMISGGLAYNKSWTVFDYTDNRSEQELRANQLLKVWVNGLDTLRKDYGDAPVTINTQRLVKHHNEFSQFSIPLSIGYRMQKGKFSYGASIGTELNFLISQSGKGLDETAGLIIEYDKASSNAPLNQFNIGIRANALIAYSLSEHLMFNVTPSWIFQNHDNGTQKLNIQQLGLNLGLQWRL